MYKIIEQPKRKSEHQEESRPVKQSRSMTTGLSAISITPEDSVSPASPASPASPIEVDQDMNAEFKPIETWARVKELVLTSNEYTARDKKEIIGQSKTFEGLPVIKELAAAAEGQKKEILQGIYEQASQQLTLYYLVGAHGWETAVATVKSSEAVSLGIPEPVFKPASNIIYVKPNSYTAKDSQSGSNYSKKGKGRRAYKKH